MGRMAETSPAGSKEEATVKLENLSQGRLNTTLMGVVKAVLDFYHIDSSEAWAFGGSGHAFLINIHAQLCPSGPYCWKYEGFQKLLRNLGLEMTDLGFFTNNSSPGERAAVEHKLKQSLDSGIPCSLANMEHQVISGYDDRAFFTAQPWGDCCGGFPPATLTFGTWPEFKDEIHVNFFTFKKLAPADDAKIVKDSLGYALDLFRHPEKHNFERYGIGLKAYDNWTGAVAAGQGASHGNWWNGTVWSECRAMASGYFAEVGKRLGKVAGPAQELSASYRQIADLLSKAADKELAPADKTAVLAELKEKEGQAVKQVESLLGSLNRQ
jgi:hypothetical protein